MTFEVGIHHELSVVCFGSSGVLLFWKMSLTCRRQSLSVAQCARVSIALGYHCEVPRLLLLGSSILTRCLGFDAPSFTGYLLPSVLVLAMTQARRRSRSARQDRYRAEGMALPQKTKDEIKRLKDEATHNDLAEEARPGDAAWVKAVWQEHVDMKKFFSKCAMKMSTCSQRCSSRRCLGTLAFSFDQKT